MTRHMLGAVLAASLALTGLSAAPARAADPDEVARFILGATTLFIIGREISKQQRNDRGHVQRRVGPPPKVHHPRRGRHRYALPSSCIRIGNGHRGEFRYFGPRCLRRHGSALPNVCHRQIRGPRGGYRDVFGAHCLRRNGYRFN